MERKDIKYYEKRRDEIQRLLSYPLLPEDYREMLEGALVFAIARIQMLTDIANVVDAYIKSN